MCPYLLVQKTREQNLPSPSNIFKDLFCLYWLLTFINFICCFAWETEVFWGWCISITISMAFDSKDSKIKIITKNTNTANTPNELGLQINTQNVVLYFKKKKIHSWTLWIKVFSVFIYYSWGRWLPLSISSVFLYVHIILEYKSFQTYECFSFLGATWRAGDIHDTVKQILLYIWLWQALMFRGLSLCWAYHTYSQLH